MASLPNDILKMLEKGNIRNQVMDAAKKAEETYRREILGLRTAEPYVRGMMYQFCVTWQNRYNMALHSELPDWSGLAAFRAIPDFVLDPNDVTALLPEGLDLAGLCAQKQDCPQIISTLEEIGLAYIQYHKQKRDLYSGKFFLRDNADAYFRSQLSNLTTVIGGQAGNIAWLWACMKVDGTLHVPYLYEALLAYARNLEFPIKILQYSNNATLHYPIESQLLQAGVRTAAGSLVDAPSGGSIVIFQNGRRLIFQFQGVCTVQTTQAKSLPFDEVQYLYQNKPIDNPVRRTPKLGDSWPAVPFFSEASIQGRTLMLSLIDVKRLEAVFKGKIEIAVIGGLDRLFSDPWIPPGTPLQVRLLNLVKEQLRLLRQCGVRISIEISSLLKGEYARFIKELCSEKTIVALGVNGIDELPDLVGIESLKNQLHEFWLDPETVDSSLTVQLEDPKNQGSNFEYITYLRARKLAETFDVRTLYVHTLNLDFILRRNADPGALLRAQTGDMMGKGLVIAALLKRQYSAAWLNHAPQMQAAINPEAMSKLIKFALDFERYERLPNASQRLIRSGYWFAPQPEQYSLAVVPVMWPDPKSIPSPSFAQTLNVTGAGDMTSGAFFFLGGV